MFGKKKKIFIVSLLCVCFIGFPHLVLADGWVAVSQNQLVTIQEENATNQSKNKSKETIIVSGEIPETNLKRLRKAIIRIRRDVTVWNR